MKKIDFFAAKICITIMCLFFTITIVRTFTRAVILIKGQRVTFGEIILFDAPDLQIPKLAPNINLNDNLWYEKYPFSTDDIVQTNNEKSENLSPENQDSIRLEIKQISRAVDAIQTWINASFFLKNKFIGFCSIINLTLNWSPDAPYAESESGVVELPNGQFTAFVSKGDVSEKVKSLNSFNEFLKTKNIPFLYVQAPYKVDPNDKTISGVSDFSNQNANEFLQQITLKEINFIDMRKEIEKTGKDFYSFFYKTDHHWTAEAGLWTTKIIAEKLNNDFGLEIDSSIYETENFNYTIFEKSFLGSRGRTKKLPLKYMEDITLIEPKENYSLIANIYSSNSVIREKSGGFETLIFKEHLQDASNAYTDNAYAIYINGDTIMQITNHSSKNKTRILILGDSFTDVVEPFLCLGVAQLDCVDLRLFAGSLKTWINTHEHYDACVFLINADSVAGEINKANHADLWDFR